MRNIRPHTAMQSPAMQQHDIGPMTVLVIHGERDQLVPVGAARYLAEHLPQARLEIIPRAGHAPFLTHLPLFLDKLKGFIHG